MSEAKFYVGNVGNVAKMCNVFANGSSASS